MNTVMLAEGVIHRLLAQLLGSYGYSGSADSVLVGGGLLKCG